MTSTYTPSLRFDLQGVGDNPTTWGAAANNDFTLIDSAIAGVTTINMADADVTLTANNGTSDQARSAILRFNGTNTAVRVVTIPLGISKAYVVYNVTVGGYDITVKTTGAPGINIPSGTSRFIWTDGASMYGADDAGYNRTWNGGAMATFRNRVINGDATFAQRATSGTASGYCSLDRWYNTKTGSSCTLSQQSHTLGQNNVPGNPEFFMRAVVTSVAGANNYVYISQSIEDVRTLSASLNTVTFWAKADATKVIGVEMYQYFGSGGSPSSGVSQPLGAATLTTSWQRFDFVYTSPSIAGKTIGTDNMDAYQLAFWLDAGSNNSTQSSGCGQKSGTFDFSHISVVPGDASKEVDPSTPRSYGQELALCQRYFEKSLPVDVAVGTANVVGAVTWAASSASGNCYPASSRFAVVKRAVPTVAFYSTATATLSGRVYNASTTTDHTISGVAATGTTGTGWVGLNTAPAAGNQFSHHWTADAEL